MFDWSLKLLDFLFKCYITFPSQETWWTLLIWHLILFLQEHKENVNPDEYEQYSPEEEEEEYYKPKKNKSFVKRSCRSRNVISYKFDEFDDMINTAIKEDLENPQPYNPGKGIYHYF